MYSWVSSSLWSLVVLALYFYLLKIDNAFVCRLCFFMTAYVCFHQLLLLMLGWNSWSMVTLSSWCRFMLDVYLFKLSIYVPSTTSNYQNEYYGLIFAIGSRLFVNDILHTHTITDSWGELFGLISFPFRGHIIFFYVK